MYFGSIAFCFFKKEHKSCSLHLHMLLMLCHLSHFTCKVHNYSRKVAIITAFQANRVMNVISSVDHKDVWI